MTTYHAEVWREHDAWVADVTDADGAHTYSRTLRGLHHEIREAIAAAEDLPDDAVFDVHVDWKNTDQEIRDLVEIGERRRELDDQRRVLLVEGTLRARKLLDRGIAVRDVAAMMVVSPGRVSQLLGGGRG